MENGKVKFCGNCGAKMPETAQFCPKCGGKAPVTSGQSVAQNNAAATVGAPSASSTMPSRSATPAVPAAGQTGSTSGYAAETFSAQGASSFGGAGSSARMQTMPQTDLGMNWYKFIIYFSLFAGAVISVVLALVLFTGSHYGGYADIVYMFFGSLRVFDVIFALVFLALAVMAIYVRQKLAHFRRDAPRLFYMLIVASGAANLIYVWGLFLLLASATSAWLDTSSLYDVTSVVSATIGTIVGCAISLGINVTYFEKRAHLFVN